MAHPRHHYCCWLLQYSSLDASYARVGQYVVSAANNTKVTTKMRSTPIRIRIWTWRRMASSNNAQNKNRQIHSGGVNRQGYCHNHWIKKQNMSTSAAEPSVVSPSNSEAKKGHAKSDNQQPPEQHGNNSDQDDDDDAEDEQGGDTDNDNGGDDDGNEENENDTDNGSNSEVEDEDEDEDEDDDEEGGRGKGEDEKDDDDDDDDDEEGEGGEEEEKDDVNDEDKEEEDNTEKGAKKDEIGHLERPTKRTKVLLPGAYSWVHDVPEMLWDIKVKDAREGAIAVRDIMCSIRSDGSQSEKTTLRAFIGRGGHAVLLGAMKKHANNVKFQSEAILLVREILRGLPEDTDNKDVLEYLVLAGTIESLVAAIKQMKVPDDTDIHTKYHVVTYCVLVALETISELVKVYPTDKAASLLDMLDMGVLTTTVESLKGQKDEGLLQDQAVKIFLTLSKFQGATRSMFAEVGAISLIGKFCNDCAKFDDEDEGVEESAIALGKAAMRSILDLPAK